MKKNSDYPTNSQKLQRLLILYWALGSFAISAVVALMSIMPLYNQLKKQEERNLQFALHTRTMTVEQFLSRAKDIAEQITSRTKGRQQLEQYNQGRLGLDEVTNFGTKLLTDAMKRTEDIAGITRLDGAGAVVARVGLPIPAELWLVPPIASQKTLVSDQIGLQGESYLVVGAPIINPSSKQRIGTDIVLFKITSLQRIITDYTGLGETGETILGAVNNNQVQLFFPLRNQVRASSAILQEIGKCVASREAGLRKVSVASGDTVILSIEPIKNSNWGLAIKIDRGELYAPVNRQLVIVGIAIAFLSGLGTGGVVLLLRPLTGRVLIHTDALEQQVREKTVALQELKHAQTQLVQNEKMAALGQLVAGVAHEINNPTSFIYGNIAPATDYASDLIGMMQLYAQHYPHPHPEIKSAAEEIDLEFLLADFPKLLKSMKVGAERIREIVKSLRTFSRLDEAQIKQVDIHEGIDSTLMILDSRLKEQPDRPRIEIIKNYGKLPLVECYPGQLNQVFMNILVNAIDAIEYLNNQDLSQTGKIWISTSLGESDQVVIKIKDNGSGMPTHVRNSLFDPFFTTKPVGKGTGLGLSISYQIVVDRHGGELCCLSEPDAGTEFAIAIPLGPKCGL
ncbi:MAG: sensor histidine kinase [Hormoscilla sp. GUM202]|nr:sensor histidine kinase [Hormoscilla sp. GUM202]